jgi:hypothetical protein
MNHEILYIAERKSSPGDSIIIINKILEEVFKRFGAKTINVSYLYSDGFPTESYSYYKFPRLGIVTIFSKFKGAKCNLSVNFSGFEGQIESYNKLKMYIEDTLKKVLY